MGWGWKKGGGSLKSYEISACEPGRVFAGKLAAACGQEDGWLRRLIDYHNIEASS